MGAKKLLNCLIITLLSITLISCGETDEEKLEKKVDNLIEEYHDLAGDLTSTAPSSNWTDGELTAYSKKLDRLESVYSELMELDSENSQVIIWGGENTNEFVYRRRGEIRSAWSEKKQTKQVRVNKEEKIQREINLLNSFKVDLSQSIIDAQEITENNYDQIASADESFMLLEKDISSLESLKYDIKKLIRKINSTPNHHQNYSIESLSLISLLVEARNALNLIESSLKVKKNQMVQIAVEI